jgi:hypothetical protein
MHFALSRFNEWKNFSVQVVNDSILFSQQGGDAIAVPISTSNLNPSYPSKKF